MREEHRPINPGNPRFDGRLLDRGGWVYRMQQEAQRGIRFDFHHPTLGGFLEFAAIDEY